MENQLTLNNIKKQFDKETRTRYTQVTFLQAILPPTMYQNPTAEKNIHLCDSYDTIKGWLSNIMNYKPNVRNGADRVRTILMGILLDNTTAVINEIADNCHHLCDTQPPHSMPLSQIVQSIVENDTALPCDFREQVSPLFTHDPYHAMAWCIVYALFPKRGQQIINLISSSSPMPQEPNLPCNNSPSDCLKYLYGQFSTFINWAKDESELQPDDSYWERTLKLCKRVLQYEIFLTDISDELFGKLNALLDSMRAHYYWDECHMVVSPQESMNNYGQKLLHLAEMENALADLRLSLSPYFRNEKTPL